MSFDNFTDYLKEDMWYGPDFQGTDVHSQHDSLLPGPPAFDIDFDILCLLARDEIQTLEQSIRSEWDQSRWGCNVWECDGVANGPENHWETVETGLGPNLWGTSPTTGPDTCASAWSALSPCDGLSPSIPNEMFPTPGLYSPTFHRPTEPSVNGPPLGHTKNSMQYPHLETEARIGETPYNPLLQAAVPETSRIEVSHTGATHGTFNRSMGLPSVQPLRGSQPSEERDLIQVIEFQSSPVPQKSATNHTFSPAKGESFSTGPSSHRKRKRSGTSTPPPHANDGRVPLNGTLPGSQSLLPENTTERETTNHTPSGTSSVKRAKRGKRSSPGSKKLDSQKLEDLLMQWGFVRFNNTVRCSCGWVFGRRYDARRHWESAFQHRAKRQKAGDFRDSLQTRCDICKEVLSREDSLARHRPNCGKRRKRHYPYGWNPNGGAQ